MKDPASMRVMNSARKLGNQLRRPPDRYRFALATGRIRRGGLEEFVERAALNEFHAEVARPITLHDFVNRNDIRMTQTRRSFRFEPESFKARWCSPLASPENL